MVCLVCKLVYAKGPGVDSFLFYFIGEKGPWAYGSLRQQHILLSIFKSITSQCFIQIVKIYHRKQLLPEITNDLKNIEKKHFYT